MNRTSLDTNIILRIVLNDVPEKAGRAAGYIDRTACYVSDIVIAECVFVLEKIYKLNRKTISTLMLNFLELETIAFNDTLIEKTFDIYAGSGKLSFVDCYSVIEAAANDSTLLTFDRAIIKKHGNTAIEPS
jgi:predicted nucleic-acid-binding protein